MSITYFAKSFSQLLQFNPECFQTLPYFKEVNGRSRRKIIFKFLILINLNFIFNYYFTVNSVKSVQGQGENYIVQISPFEDIFKYLYFFSTYVIFKTFQKIINEKNNKYIYNLKIKG